MRSGDRSGLVRRVNIYVYCGRGCPGGHHCDNDIELHGEFDAAAGRRYNGIIDQIAVVADARAGKNIHGVRPVTPERGRNSFGFRLLHERIQASGPGQPAIMPEQINAVARIVPFKAEYWTTQRRIKSIADSGPNAPELHERIGIAKLFVGIDCRPGKDRRSDLRTTRLEAEKRTGANDVQPGLRGTQRMPRWSKLIRARHCHDNSGMSIATSRSVRCSGGRWQMSLGLAAMIKKQVQSRRNVIPSPGIPGLAPLAMAPGPSHAIFS